jgi:hypothetical protein
MNKGFFCFRIITGIVFTAFLMMAVVASSPSWATDGFMKARSGKYEWQLKTDKGNEVIIINTSFPMTTKKEDFALNERDIEKVCNAAGRSVYGQLMKITEVSRVIISTRQIAIRKFDFPMKWDAVIPQILSTMDDIVKEIK